MSDDNDPRLLADHLASLELQLRIQVALVQSCRKRGSYELKRNEVELDRLLDKWAGVRDVLVLHTLEFDDEGAE